jgi:hypothetical protein
MTLAVAAVLAVPAAAVALRLEYRGDPAAAGRSRGHDAVRLGHAWVDGRHATESDWTAFRDGWGT